MPMRRVAITGATGFLGGRLAHRLAARGNGILAFGRDAAKGLELERNGISFCRLDLQEKVTPDLLAEVDVFVHAAALSSAWGSVEAFRSANVAGTERALLLARRMGAKRFVFISSPSVTFAFGDRSNVREDDPLPPPVNAYAASKVAAEALVRQACDLHPVILRPRAIYGRGDTALLPRLVRAARTGPLPLIRSGLAVTQLTHVEDAVSAIVAAIDAPDDFKGGTYHVAGPDVLPIRTIADAACRRAGIEPRWRAVPWPLARIAVGAAEQICRLRKGSPEPRVTLFGLGIFAFSQVLDTSAIRKDLGFAPAIDFREGLEEAFSEWTA